MKRRATLSVVVLFAFFLATTVDCFAKSDPPLIQLAILLDTSNSMDGLIAQAKTQLWKIVNELARVKRDGKSGELHVGLYEYGKDSIPAQEGFLRMISPLTRDLDLISEELFNLKTNGGSEYCGTVIESAVNGLKWSTRHDDLKIIFIAGNEPFTQGSVAYQKSCKSAISKGIIVNTIFCGDYNEGVNTKWKHGSELADGNYLNIDQNQKIRHIDAPQDAELARLGEELNKTYLAYGKKGKKMKTRQEEQDSNALSLGRGVMAERAAAKASSHYTNTSWDLVDAEKEGNLKLDEVENEDLPPEMRSMSDEDRKAYLESTRKKREQLQQEIQKLNETRRKYVAEQMKDDTQNTLDNAIIQTIHEQVGKRNMDFHE